jgi:hypothetical protein
MFYTTVSPSGSKVIIHIDGDVMTSFSENPENTDYQRYLEWQLAGNVPQPWEG